MKHIFLKKLAKTIKLLESEKVKNQDNQAIDEKIILNQSRLDYFSAPDSEKKLTSERAHVVDFLSKLPQPDEFLLGDKISAVDIVVAVLLARLFMINEYWLVESKPLKSWFLSIQSTEDYKKSDIWTHFKPWRIVFKY